MEIALHVVSAFDTLAQPVVSPDALEAELCASGLSPADSQLAIERAVTEGLLLRDAEGRLLKSAAESDRVTDRNRLPHAAVR